MGRRPTPLWGLAYGADQAAGHPGTLAFWGNAHMLLKILQEVGFRVSIHVRPSFKGPCEVKQTQGGGGKEMDILSGQRFGAFISFWSAVPIDAS